VAWIAQARIIQLGSAVLPAAQDLSQPCASMDRNKFSRGTQVAIGLFADVCPVVKPSRSQVRIN